MVDPIIFILITTLGVSLGIKLTSTQNPVYSALYLVLLFFLGSSIAFLLGLEFIGLLFLLVYAGAIAVLVLFVVMMLDVKAIAHPWSAKKKRLLYLAGLNFFFCLIFIGWSQDFQQFMKLFATFFIGSLVLFSPFDFFGPITSGEDFLRVLDYIIIEALQNHPCSESLPPIFHMYSPKESIDSSYNIENIWFVEFDTFCGLNDPSYLLYSTYAILLIIAGVILLIAMVGAISLTLQKNCPDSLYRQLGREHRNAVFSIKETTPSRTHSKAEVSS